MASQKQETTPFGTKVFKLWKKSEMARSELLQNHISPSELRNVFGSNLRKLAEQHASIAELSRALDINRTQFNRYMTGDSFPRPDILAKICQYFNVDARILLEPLEEVIANEPLGPGAALKEFVGEQSVNVPEELFPSGFYQFSRRSFINSSKFVMGLTQVFRTDGGTFIRGYEAREAMRMQGLPVSKHEREFRGQVLRQGEGLGSLITRRGGDSSNFNYLARNDLFVSKYYTGYAALSVRELPDGQRVQRMIYEYMGPEISTAIAAARHCGFKDLEELPEYHQRLLQPEKEFR